MRRPFRFKPTKRQQYSVFNAWDAFYAAAADKVAIPRELPPERKRAVTNGTAKPEAKPQAPLEADVIRAVSELLAVHPRVLFACRQNSGAASYEAKSGKFQPIHFYRILTSQPVTITDFWGILRDGRPFAMEAKREGFYEPHTQREFRQANFLMLIRNAGGIAGFVTNADEAKELLDA